MRITKPVFITLAAVATLLEIRAASAAPACSASARRANLDFTLPDVAGQAISLRELRGDLVLINFWATWCAPCRVEIPHLVALYQKYRARGLVILGVSVDDPVSRLRPFVAELRISYPVLVGAAQREFLESFGQLTGFPTSVLISRDGKVCAQYVGLADTEQLERQIQNLL
jgi:thiol-disulfide isomerase/thioredoxin